MTWYLNACEYVPAITSVEAFSTHFCDLYEKHSADVVIEHFLCLVRSKSLSYFNRRNDELPSVLIQELILRIQEKNEGEERERNLVKAKGLAAILQQIEKNDVLPLAETRIVDDLQGMFEDLSEIIDFLMSGDHLATLHGLLRDGIKNSEAFFKCVVSALRWYCEKGIIDQDENEGYWRGHYSPKDENDCTKVLAKFLRHFFILHDIQIVIEERIDRNRCDLVFHCGEMRLPLEAKVQSNAGLYKNLDNQLIKKYVTADPTLEYGIYFIYWFGEGGPIKKVTCPSSASLDFERPSSHIELENILTKYCIPKDYTDFIEVICLNCAAVADDVQKGNVERNSMDVPTRSLGFGKEGSQIEVGREIQKYPLRQRIMNKIVKSSMPPFPVPENVRFKFVDLFAGIGGTRIPFQELGGKCVFASEWDKFAQKTYYTNFGHQPAGDIEEVEEWEIPDHDILLAGFPCQAFFQAGVLKGFAATRGTMFFEIARILKAKRPAAVLLENVKSFKHHNKGRTFAAIKSILEDDLGYNVTSDVLRATDFGVPQNRERTFIVCFRKDILKNGEKEFSYKFPAGSCTPTKVGDILEDDPVDPKYTISERLYEGLLRRRKLIGNGVGGRTVNAESRHTSTISVRYGIDGSEILVEQEGQMPRKLTPKECRRLQGFPDDFVIPVSDAQAYRQFGVSACVPVVRAVAESMLMVLEKYGVLEEMEKRSNFGKAI